MNLFSEFEKELDNITMVKEHRKNKSLWYKYHSYTVGRGEDLLLCGSDEDCKEKVNTEWEKFLTGKD